MRVSAPLLLLALLSAPAGAGEARDFEFGKLNRGYRDLLAEAPEIRSGALSVKLTSPQQAVIVKSHRLRLARLPDGSFLGSIAVEFYGRGRLVADLAYGSIAERLEDELFVPTQRLELPARVRVVREAGGYRFLATELPPEVRVEIHSRLAAQAVALCQGASLLALGQIDCAGVERQLTQVAVPLPASGAEFTLAAEEMSAAERADFERFLATKP